MEHKKYISDSLLLTKEAFEQYTRKLREERAKEFGMTLEEWDKAVLNQTTINTPNQEWNGPTGSLPAL